MAVKLIDKTKLDAKTQRMLVREIQIMDKLAHPCLIRYLCEIFVKPTMQREMQCNACTQTQAGFLFLPESNLRLVLDLKQRGSPYRF